jgi:hypothetical protein
LSKTKSGKGQVGGSASSRRESPKAGSAGSDRAPSSKRRTHAIILAVVAVCLVLLIGLSVKFVLESKENVASSYTLEMNGPDDQHVESSGFIRADGLISISYSGNVKVFESQSGSFQGTAQLQEERSGESSYKLTDPSFSRGMSIWGGEYSLYVVMPSGDTLIGSWRLCVVDDNGKSEPVSFWLNLEEDNTATLGVCEENASDPDWSPPEGEGHSGTWQTEEDGSITVVDETGCTWTVSANFEGID